jgi:hypothetical protein
MLCKKMELGYLITQQGTTNSHLLIMNGFLINNVMFLQFSTDCYECSCLSRNSAMGPQIPWSQTPVTIHINEYTDVYESCWITEIKEHIKHKPCSSYWQDLLNTLTFCNRHLTDFLRLLWIVVTHCGVQTDYSLIWCLSATQPASRHLCIIFNGMLPWQRKVNIFSCKYSMFPSNELVSMHNSYYRILQSENLTTISCNIPKYNSISDGWMKVREVYKK